MAVAGGIESIPVADMLYVVMINISLRRKLWLDFLIQPNRKLEARHVEKLAGVVGEEAERMIGLLNEAIIRAGSGLMRMIWG